MANRADIVIGANFGDEGKGLVTDYLASKKEDTIVVRHNGGAQAGHTVTTPDGKRHVFKHFSSGSFVCAKTYLSRFYVCNPLLYFKELEVLKELGVNPEVHVDPKAAISTPYDMMINQIVEEYRGSGRHGSCGVGFGETLERQGYPEYSLLFSDLKDCQFFKQRLEKIRSEWLPWRLGALGIKTLSYEWMSRIHSQQIFDLFCKQAKDFCDVVNPSSVDILASSKAVVFEGAQGLLLDQNYGWFPHVTRSNTGIKNALELCKDADIHDIRATYITRAYNTRHGAGPMQHETEGKPYARIHDATNIYNEYQGGLRFGWLDLDQLAASIHYDVRHAYGKVKFSHRLAVTCMDQLDEDVTYIHSSQKITTSASHFLHTAMEATGVQNMYVSRGPTRKNVRLQRKETQYSLLSNAFKDGAGYYAMSV